MIQLTTTLVRDLLPKNYLLNIKDNDFVSLEGITDVDKQFFRHVFTCQEKEIAFDSEPSDENGEHSDLETSAGLDNRVEDLQQTRQFIDNGCGCNLVKGIELLSVRSFPSLSSIYKLSFISIPFVLSKIWPRKGNNYEQGSPKEDYIPAVFFLKNILLFSQPD